MKTNVLLIIEELELGGAERVVIDQARSFDRERYNVKVCCLREKGDFAPELEKYNIEIIELHKKRGIDLSIISKAVRVIKENSIDIVHTHLWVANLWGRLASFVARVPVIVTEHNVDVWKKWYHKLIDRILIFGTKKVCVVSEQVKEFYIHEVGLPEKKLEVVYNGIGEAQKSSAVEVSRLKEEFGIKNGTPVLVNIGRLVEAKANHFFIDALNQLDQKNIDYHALIIGDGPLRKKLEAQGQSLMGKKKLIFTGLRKDVLSILDFVSLSILSSTREGLPITLLESMSKGIPVVVTDVGGNKELVVDGKTGFVVRPRDPTALAKAMKTVIEDSNLSKIMSQNAINRVREHFSLDAMIAKTEEIYNEVLNHE